MRILISTLCLLAALIAPLIISESAFAQNGTPEKLVKIRILPETGQINPGDEIWIGTEQSITKHWHTYWKNPGDSGIATSIDWALPEGFEIGEIQWPTPQKFPYGHLLNYGYENKVILLQKLKAPENLPDGPIKLTANIELLVCKEECIPEYETYDLILNGAGAALENNKAFLQTAQESLPKNGDFPTFFYEENLNFIIEAQLPDDILKNINLTSAAFLPEEWGLISNPEKPRALIRNKKLIIEQKRDNRALEDIDNVNGVLIFSTNNQQKYAINIQASPLQSSANNKVNSSQQTLQKKSDLNIISAIIFALIGGLILNLMPCVFPVLSIKALSLVKISEKHPERARMHGISYTAGVILSFLLIAGTLIALKAGGSQIGWGFQLQNPLVIGTLGYLLFAISLNLIGFFEVSNAFANTGNKLTHNDGLSGSFFTGVLATLVATPCTAPFMAGAISYAFIQPPIISVIVFSALGLGLALPYLALSFVPSLQKILPKPGAWMDIFKQLLAFPMFAATLWLLWVLGQQSGTAGIIAALTGALMIAFSIWLFKHIPANPNRKFMVRALGIILVIGALAILPKNSIIKDPSPSQPSAFGQDFSQNRLDELLAGDAPVFTEMTAAWCITCKVNHAIALNIESTKALFAKHNVQYLIGDWTNEDPQITKYLQKHGRNGVPLYVFYGERNSVTKQRPEPKLLPQVLTPKLVKNYVQNNQK